MSNRPNIPRGSQPPPEVAMMLARYRENIARFGWVVTGVAEDGRCDTPGCTSAHGPHDPFLYTVGLTDAGLPELLVRHLNARQSAGLLNALARQSAGEALTLGGRYEAAGLAVTALHLPSAQARQLCKVARAMYGDARLKVVELVPAGGGDWPSGPAAAHGEHEAHPGG